MIKFRTRRIRSKCDRTYTLFIALSGGVFVGDSTGRLKRSVRYIYCILRTVGSTKQMTFTFLGFVRFNCLLWSVH